MPAKGLAVQSDHKGTSSAEEMTCLVPVDWWLRRVQGMGHWEGWGWGSTLWGSSFSHPCDQFGIGYEERLDTFKVCLLPLKSCLAATTLRSQFLLCCIDLSRRCDKLNSKWCLSARDRVWAPASNSAVTCSKGLLSDVVLVLKVLDEQVCSFDSISIIQALTLICLHSCKISQFFRDTQRAVWLSNSC